MKQNRLTKLLAAGALSAIALSTAFGQASSSTTTTTSSPAITTSTTGTTGVTTSTTGGTTSATTSTSTVDGSGTITTYSPGSDHIMFRSETSTTPVKYYYTKTTTVVDSDGKTVEWSALKPDMPVRYTYVKDGDRMVISKITLTKPIATYEKTTTTTTTTKP